MLLIETLRIGLRAVRMKNTSSHSSHYHKSEIIRNEQKNSSSWQLFSSITIPRIHAGFCYFCLWSNLKANWSIIGGGNSQFTEESIRCHCSHNTLALSSQHPGENGNNPVAMEKLKAKTVELLNVRSNFWRTVKKNGWALCLKKTILELSLSEQSSLKIADLHFPSAFVRFGDSVKFFWMITISMITMITTI